MGGMELLISEFRLRIADLKKGRGTRDGSGELALFALSERIRDKETGRRRDKKNAN